MQKLKDRLRELYNDASKHSNYQSIPGFLRQELDYSETIDEGWRGDAARYAYIQHELDIVPGTIVSDVGANTGFFSLSLAHLFKESEFIAYEANENHVEFIQLVIDSFDLHNVRVIQKLIDLSGINSLEPHDIMLHLNVLHHAGHDFDKESVTGLQGFERYAIEYLKKLGEKTTNIVFQMGSNWGGDKAQPIVQREDDVGKVNFFAKLFSAAGWDIRRIALATRDGNGTIVYKNLPEQVVDGVKNAVEHVAISELGVCIREYDLDQFRGEFYRRPIFICESETQTT